MDIFYKFSILHNAIIFRKKVSDKNNFLNLIYASDEYTECEGKIIIFHMDQIQLMKKISVNLN